MSSARIKNGSASGGQANRWRNKWGGIANKYISFYICICLSIIGKMDIVRVVSVLAQHICCFIPMR